MTDGKESELGSQETFIDSGVTPRDRHLEAGTSMRARLEGTKTSFSMQALLEGAKPSSSIQALLEAVKVNPSMKTLLEGTKTSLSRHALLEGARQRSSLKAVLEGAKPSSSIQALLEALKINPSLRALLEGARPRSSLKAMLEGAMPNSSFQALLKDAKTNPSMKALLKGTKTSLSMQALSAGLQSFTDSPEVKALVDSASSLAPERWGLSSSTTLVEVLQELVVRTAASEEAPTDRPDQSGSEVGFESALSISDNYSIEIVQAKSPEQPICSVPTWILLVWIWFFSLIVNWEDARTGLADINARLPQTETLKEVRQFIRNELAGKPGDFRIVTGANVNLRAGPGMKSEVLLHLPKESIVVVLGKENRTWMLVSYEHQGYMIDGYVSTTYLKKVR